MNIIVLIIDTLRYDRVGANGNERVKTPNMDRLAADSWVFDRSFAASYPTLPHRTDVLTGRYGGPFHEWRPLRYDVLTFPQHLAGEGYATQLIHDTPHMTNGGHNFDWPFQGWTMIRGGEADRPWVTPLTKLPANWGRDPVFDYADESRLAADGVLQNYMRASRDRASDEEWSTARLFTTAARWLRENASRERFLLWVDCFDPHEPWDAPPEYVKMYDSFPGFDGRFDPRSHVGRNAPGRTPEAERRMTGFYDAKVSWVDRWLGEVLDALDETGLSRNTAVILTADHGTNLGERSRFGKAWPPRDPEAHTPFILRVPGGGAGRSQAIVQPQDVFPTVAALAGVPLPEGLAGQDLVAVAGSGGEGGRELALCGSAAGPRWARDDADVLFSALEREWCLEFAPTPERSVLRRIGSQEDESAERPEIVRRLHALALDEVERRGAAPELVDWLRGGGRKAFPEGVRLWDGWPGPPGYASYFSAERILREDIPAWREL